MRINNNIMAMNTYRQLGITNNSSAKAMEKLSSGLRINRAGDDAAGLAISEKMRGQIRGLTQASRNAQDGISLIQTAEGALNETHAILQRMRELAVQSATDTNTADDRIKIQSEVDQLAKEITRISNTTEFNTQNLMAGGFSSKFQIGGNEGQNVALSIGAMDAKALGVAGDLHTDSLATSTTGVSSIGNASKNLHGYLVATAATVVATNDATASQSNGGGGAGTITGTYTGARDASFMVKIDTVAAGKVTAASISRDGGTTYENIAVDDSGANTTITVDGLTLTIATDTDNTEGDTYSFSATAEYKQIGLQDSGTNPIGSVVKVYNDMTSATIGSSASGETVTVNFNYSALVASQSDAINRNVTSSTQAVVSATGEVTTEAITYKGIDVSTRTAADSAITKINDAITQVSEERSKLGALQNRLEHSIKNLDTSAENLQAAESRIRDVDMAKEIMEFTKNNILQQAAQAMLAQANQAPQGVLQLLR